MNFLADQVQVARPELGTEPLSLYLHVPFCQVRCSYCDFNTYAGLDDLMPAYARALSREVQAVGQAAGPRLPVHTAFFGGGTPSLMPVELLAPVVQAIHATFQLDPRIEITLEANPGTVSLDYLRGLRALGINRLSLGVQSAHHSELQLFGRLHTFQDVVDAVASARQARFQSLNLDLIYGLPDQTLEAWRATLEQTLALEPEHLSAYALSLEYGTPLRAWVGRGLVQSPDPDTAADMYEWASDRLARAGYVQYEISNWARPGHECRHNLQYWRNQEYLGFGAGAHGSACGWRYSNVLGPPQYVERVASGAAAEFPFSAAMAERRRIDSTTHMGETMMLGMRLTEEGVAREAFERRYGVSLESAYARELETLERQGLVERRLDRVRLTPNGRLLGNRVFGAFV